MAQIFTGYHGVSDTPEAGATPVDEANVAQTLMELVVQQTLFNTCSVHESLGQVQVYVSSS